MNADAGPRRPRASVIAQGALLAIAAICLVYGAYGYAAAFVYQQHEAGQLETALAREPRVAAAPSPSPEPASGTAQGRIDIPRLGLSAIIKAGTDARTLRLAVGHISGTALPGEPGNVGLAGHRDTFFRGLGQVRLDDEVLLVTPDGTYRYRVEGTSVVQPDDVWVLDSTGVDVLTLVTCHPFSYIGPAPDRFIVRARLVAPSPGGVSQRHDDGVLAVPSSAREAARPDHGRRVARSLLGE
jgi:sortase A